MRKIKDFYIKCILIIVVCVSITSLLPLNVSAKTPFATSDTKRVNKKAKAIIKKVITPEMSEAEKIKAIHDYIVRNCAYDYSNLLNDTIPFVSYTANGALIKKKAVCQGYAEAFKLCMDLLKIPCKIVSGKANNGTGYNGHAWNIIKVDGKWYHIDVTWDDPVPDQEGQVLYNYFLLSDDQIDNDHIWKRSAYKKCTTDNTAEFVKLISDAATTNTDAVNAFYIDYMANNGTTSTIIIDKELFDADFNFNLFTILEDCYGICINRWEYSTPVPYGNYYIITYRNFS